MNCLLCGSHARHLSTSKDPFELWWCDACEFGRLKGDFTPEQVARFYYPGYYTHSVGGKSGERLSLVERVLIHLAWRCDHGQDFDPDELDAGRTVCDIGCGNGNTLRKFKAAGYATVGVEPDCGARRASADAGIIYAGTAEDIPPIGSFDVVLMSHTLEHCIDPVKAVSNAASLLEPDGTLVIEVPNNAAMGFRWFGPRWPWTDIPRHLSFFTDRSLSLLLEQHGLKIIKTIYTGYTRQFLPNWRCDIRSSLSGWPLLASSAFSSPRSKYDSIRIHARSSTPAFPRAGRI